MSEQPTHTPVKGSGVWEHFTVQDGLPDMKIQCLLEDRQGHLWIGTQARGVVRFDGDRFEVFTTRDGLSGNNVLSMLEDPEGDLWFGTDGGLTRYAQGTFQGVSLPSGERCSFHRGCCVDREGALWFGMSYRPGYPPGVCRWDGRHLDQIVLPDPEGIGGSVFCAAADDTGDIWFGVWASLYRYDGERFHRVGGPSSPPGYFWSVLPRSDGSLWIGGSEGLFVYAEGRFEPLEEAFMGYRTMAFLEESSGGVWVIAYDGQVWRYEVGACPRDADERTSGLPSTPLVDRGKALPPRPRGGPGRGDPKYGGRADPRRPWTEPSPEGGSFRRIRNLDADVRANLCLDRAGRRWIGTMGRGLYCYDSTRFEVFGTAQGLPSDQVRCLADDAEGRLWVGTEWGLVGYDGATFRPLEGAESLIVDHRIHTLWLDGGHRLWVSTWEGKLYVHEQGALHPVIETDCLGGIHLTEDEAGRIWFGFQNIFGFGYYEQGAVRRFVPDDRGIYPRQIGALWADRAGRLWIGSSSPGHWEGLRCYDIAALVADQTAQGSTEVAFTAFTPADGLTDGAILCLYEDRDGILWIGTSEGICCYDGTGFRTFTRADGLPHEIITCITQTEEGVLWFGTEGGGVCCYDGQVFQTIQMPEDAGWNAVYAVHQDRKGQMWFGTLGGLVRYTRHKERPEGWVTAVVADRTYKVGEQTGASAPIEVPTTAGRISVRFGGRSSIHRASRLVYRYRLRGYEEAWHQTREREVSYPPLSPGAYRFWVQAVDGDLNYSEVAEVRLTVMPDPRVVGLTEALRSSGASGEFVGTSAALQEVLARIREVARTDLGVLIQGETGTGKGLVARAVHGLSKRRDGPFILVNCGAIPEGLVESELFGHEKGGFTGATSQKLGKVELAEGGTLFLDEVGDLAWEAQAKLLRVLEEGTFERVGGTETLQADVRVIAATNRELKRMVLEGDFREDLYFRLNAFPIWVPPLRERREDIPLLADYFMERMAAHVSKAVTRLTPGAVSRLQAYAWPGNVRELEHVVGRAVVVCAGSAIQPEDLLLEGEPTDGRAAKQRLSLEEYERRYIREVLEETGWIIRGPQGAATVLGIPESTLRHRMKRLGLRRR